jgi:catechol 2,3-dioxygenase-like lactoylglutathione lyase family enzyme
MAGAKLATLIPIRNMSRAIKFYTKKLGAKHVYRAPGQMRNFWASLQLGEEVVWLIAPDKREKRALAYHAFLVKNIRGYVRGLQKKGVKFGRPERRSPKTKVEGPIAFEPIGASAFFKDSEGNLMMVWQSGPSM